MPTSPTSPASPAASTGTSDSIAIIGATSLIAEHCARLWLAQGAQRLVLVGRDATRTAQLAVDLRLRSPQAQISVELCDFLQPEAIQACVARIVADGCPTQVLIAHGALPTQSECQSDLKTNQQALQLNGISPVLFAEAFAAHMERANRGSLALIGSVAGDRGRKSNYVYGAAKGLVTRYAQGLQHRLAASAVKVVLLKPGPTDTPMTAHLKTQGAALAPVQAVAVAIVRGMAAGRPVCYVPGKWRWIMLVVRHLPRFIFNKMDI